MSEFRINVKGMSCGGCERAVEAAIAKLDGVETVKADHKSGQVTLYCSIVVPPRETIAAAVRQAGYSPED